MVGPPCILVNIVGFIPTAWGRAFAEKKQMKDGAPFTPKSSLLHYLCWQFISNLGLTVRAMGLFRRVQYLHVSPRS